MRVLIVHNPTAGMRQPDARSLIQSICDQGHDVFYRSVKEVGFDEALSIPSDLVVAAGGDGTVAKVASRLVGSDRLMTLLPLGTANNIGQHLGFPRDPFRIIEGMHALAVRRLDVGVATGPWKPRVFFEGVGAGLLAHGMPILTDDAHSKTFTSEREKVAALRRALGALLRSFDARPWRLLLDGHVVEGELLMVEALNIASVGPGLKLAPDADPSDGLFDVVCIQEKDRAWLAELLGRPDDDATVPCPVVRAREVRFEWDGSPLHVDDRVWADECHDQAGCERPKGPVPGPVTLTIHPRALHVLAPPVARAH